MFYDRSRQTFFCIGISNVWTKPISLSLKKLRNEHELKWLRPSISYHKFSNLCEKFSSDVTTKLMRGIKDLEEMDCSCNCNRMSLKANGTCLYGGKCRKGTIVYKLRDKTTGMAYVGKTQRYST